MSKRLLDVACQHKVACATGVSGQERERVRDGLLLRMSCRQSGARISTNDIANVWTFHRTEQRRILPLHAVVESL